jgi:hypothetical protein
VYDPEAVVTQDSSLPGWLADSWLLTLERSPLYRELTNVPLMVRGPGLEPGHRQAMTTAPDLAPTIVELAGLGGVPTTVIGESFGSILAGTQDEHRPFVVSSWPLYLAEGEIVTAIDSKARTIANYMPLTEDPYGSLTLFLRDTLRQHQFGVRKMLDGVTALDDAKVAYGRLEASKGCQKAKVAISPLTFGENPSLG